MRRLAIDPRPDWQKRVEQYGLHYHTLNDEPYWDESACYVFSRYEIDTLERATYALWEMCLELVEHVIQNRMFGLFAIPQEFEDLVTRSWIDEWPSIYGRFDLAFDGVGPPKLLEFNADTPTALVEASVAQWFWLKDTDERADQFNTIHDRLLEGWKAAYEQDDTHLHFAAIEGNVEDYITVEYLRDTAIQAGFETSYLDIEAIAWDTASRQFVAPGGRPIRKLFKLYPWEWLTMDEFGRQIPEAKTQWIEPPWKMILSCKSILPLLYQMYPDSPFLLPSWFDRPDYGSYVKKPIHAREGANIEVVIDGREQLHTSGPYDEEKAVYQQLAPMKSYDGRYPVFGSWMIHGWSCGLGIREDDQMITQNTSRFVPHKIAD